jgi:nucleotide-binding universal stress UspA family protein
MFSQILIAWDGSPPSEWAFDAALDLARRYEAHLCAVSIAHSPAHAETGEDREESVHAARRYLEETFEQIRDRADRAGVSVDHVVVEGDNPASDILGYAHEHGFDLLVVGHHRKTRSGRFLIHGLTAQTIEASDIPVLVVANGRAKR